MNQVTKFFKIAILTTMAITGAFNTIAFQFQDSQKQEGHRFIHPFMQTGTMFLGEALSLVIYRAMKKNDNTLFYQRIEDAQAQGKQINFNKLWLAIPALCDLVASTIQYVMFSLILQSSFQMMRGGLIITSLLFSLFYLKMKMNRKQKLGIAIAIVGMLLVGVAAIVFPTKPQKESDISKIIIGYIVIFLSLLLNSFSFAFQQKFLKKHHIEPMEMVGYEGLFGFSAQVIIIIIATFVPCGKYFSQSCVSERFQNPGKYFEAVGSSAYLLMFGLMGIFSISIFNIVGITVTKNLNSLARSTCDVSRIVFVWLADIVITVCYDGTEDNPDDNAYDWQSTQAGAIIVNVVGFIALILGNAIYNDIVAVPFPYFQLRQQSTPRSPSSSQRVTNIGASLLSN